MLGWQATRVVCTEEASRMSSLGFMCLWFSEYWRVGFSVHRVYNPRWVLVEMCEQGVRGGGEPEEGVGGRRSSYTKSSAVTALSAEDAARR